MATRAPWPTERGPERIDRAAAAVSGVSRREIKRVMQAGGVWLGKQRIRRASEIVRPGEIIQVFPEAPALAEALSAAPPPPLLVRDRLFVVVDKPAGMVVEPTPQTDVGCVVWHLQGLPPPGVAPAALHRLDREASGCVLVSIARPGRKALQAQLREHRIERDYIVIVEGDLAGLADEGRLHHREWRSRGGRRRALPVDDPRGGREMVLRYRLAERAGDRARLAVQLETGRTHQIRLQFEALGCPVVGDARYGRGGDRLALHAARLRFQHPRSRHTVRVESPLPEGFATVG